MKKKYRSGLICLWASVLCFVIQPGTGTAERSLKLDYGKVSTIDTSSPTSLNRDIPFSFATEKISGLQIETTPLTGANTRQLIPAQHLRLFLGEQSFSLSGSSIPVSLTDPPTGSGGMIRPSLSLELEPEYLADHYTGNLKITPWFEGAQGKTWGTAMQIDIAVTIRPWIKISCDSQSLALEQTVYSQLEIQSTQPLRIEIASNCDWLLSCQLTAPSLGIEPILKVERSDPARMKVLNSPAGFTNHRRNLVMGAPTTCNGKNSCQIQLSVSLQNYTAYPARKYMVPLQFTAEIVNPDPCF